MNKEKLVTIIFPSRGRYDLVEKLLLSIEETTLNKKWIEVISICDHDDKQTLNLFHNISSQITYDFKFISRKQQEKLDLPNDYYNLGLKLSSDSYFTWILGNDCKLITQDWDSNLYHAINNSAPEIFSNIEKNKRYCYLKINDDTHWDKDGNLLNILGDPSCCFPLISTNYCTDLKEFYPVEINTWGGDTCLYLLVEKSNMCDIVDAISIIQIEHYSIHNKKTEQDLISKRVETQHLEDKLHPDHWENDLLNILEKRKKFLYK